MRRQEGIVLPMVHLRFQMEHHVVKIHALGGTIALVGKIGRDFCLSTSPSMG